MPTLVIHHENVSQACRYRNVATNRGGICPRLRDFLREMTRQGAGGYITISAMEHHVYFWLKEEQKTAENRAAFEEGLRSLLRIDGVERGLWGRPAAVTPRPVIDDTWDYSLAISFASVETQDAYQVDPIHLVFLTEHKERWAKVLVMDVEPGC